MKGGETNMRYKNGRLIRFLLEVYEQIESDRFSISWSRRIDCLLRS